MTDHLSRNFVERQRQRLEALQQQLRDQENGARREEREVSEQQANEVQDSGDEGALDARRDIDDALGAEGQRRLGEIRRALEKIEEGSYGLSDDSGEPIPEARLEAMPEARRTVEEEERREQDPQPPAR